MEEVADLVKEDAPASLLLKLEIARYKIKLNAMDDAKNVLAEGQNDLDNYGGIMSAVIQSQLHLAYMEYFKVYAIPTPDATPAYFFTMCNCSKIFVPQSDRES